MADQLFWKQGEGYDIHVLRTGPASKALDQSIEDNPQSNDPLTFTALLNAGNQAGITVDPTGAVTAGALSGGTEVRNFLVKVSQGTGFETFIRVHVHTSIQKIWVTPASLSVHTHVNECRFTVLALFDDGVIGDITDWPQLTFQSADTTVVTVDAQGVLEGVIGGPSNPPPIDITVSLQLTTPSLNLSTTGKAVVALNWLSLSRGAPVVFVDGPLRPDPTDLGGTNKNSVPKVVKDQTNILFISEGFQATQAKDFNQLVQFVIKTGLKEGILEPFGMLSKSVNYWSLFIPSPDDGITLLGEYSIGKPSKRGGVMGYPVAHPEAPSLTAAVLSLENMIFQLGLPAPNDPVETIDVAVARWNTVYQGTVTVNMVAGAFAEWNDLRKRTILNERDTAFGFTEAFRPRVSPPSSADPLLGLNSRRTSQASLEQFIGALTFGQPPENDDPFNIGETWSRTNKDFGLACYICLCERDAGEALTASFAVTTGYERLVRLKAVTNGSDVLTAGMSDPGAPYDDSIISRTVAHECAHAFGTGDEYGPGTTNFVLGQSGVPIFPNLQVKTPPLVTGANPEIYDTSQIKWLFPRTIKLGVLQNVSTPDPANAMEFTVTANQVQPAKPLPATPAFAAGDLVMIRQAPLKKSDPFASLRFLVSQVFTNGGLDLTQQGGTPLDPTLFDPTILTVLICVNRGIGQPELKVIADSIANWIQTSHGPLTGPKSNPGAVCIPSDNRKDVQTPTNLPVPPLKFKKSPAAFADILGLYEGGGHFDCGVFRPAGRCKMRTTESKVIPFCHVCRILITDRVNALKLIDLDGMYDPFYPT